LRAVNGKEKTMDVPSPVSGARTIAEVLADARARLTRLTPVAAHRAQQEGAVLLDIRPHAQRARQGHVPGAVIVERTVLEWRLDPASDARLDFVEHHNLRLVVLCSEGYSSSLAAVSLQELGFADATDIIGGFKAWAAAELPTLSARA
jgi:rhodanese-related sulfurtransferase